MVKKAKKRVWHKKKEKMMTSNAMRAEEGHKGTTKQADQPSDAPNAFLNHLKKQIRNSS